MTCAYTLPKLDATPVNAASYLILCVVRQEFIVTRNIASALIRKEIATLAPQIQYQ